MLEVSLIIGSTDQVVITDIIGAHITLGDLAIIVVVDTHEQFIDNFSAIEINNLRVAGELKNLQNSGLILEEIFNRTRAHGFFPELFRKSLIGCNNSHPVVHCKFEFNLIVIVDSGL